MQVSDLNPFPPVSPTRTTATERDESLESVTQIEIGSAAASGGDGGDSMSPGQEGFQRTLPPPVPLKSEKLGKIRQLIEKAQSRYESKKQDRKLEAFTKKRLAQIQQYRDNQENKDLHLLKGGQINSNV